MYPEVVRLARKPPPGTSSPPRLDGALSLHGVLSAGSRETAVQRRQFLAAAAGLGLAGCLAPSTGSPGDEQKTGTGRTTASTGTAATDRRTTKPDSRYTAVRATGDGLRATFRIVDVHAPAEERASATFEDDRVVVTGTVDPGGCRRPTLGSVGHDGETVSLVVVEAWRFGPTATVECGNASFDYRGVVTGGSPSTVAVIHEHHEDDDRAFTFERG
jgi:hypothetical protein